MTNLNQNNGTSNYLKTSKIVEVENYPYGFRFRTTLTDYMEFDKKKGYRHCTRTVDPKTGRINNPKKSTYYPLMVRYYDENGHIQCYTCHFNGNEEINTGCKFIADNFEIFTPEEIKHLYAFIHMMAKVDFQAICQYGGSKAEDSKPLYIPFLQNCKKGHETGENLFNLLILDSAAINATKPANFQPFKITSYGI